MAGSLLADASTADDVVQDACLAALEHPPRKGPLERAWFVGVVRNLARRTYRDTARRERRERAASRSEAVLPAAQAAEQIEAHRRLIDAVHQLSDPYRTAVVERYFDGLTPREIADRHGVPRETASTWIHRGLAMLRARLSEDGDDWRAALVPLFSIRRPAPVPPLVPVVGAIVMSVKLWIGAGAAAALLVAAILYSRSDETPQRVEIAKCAEAPTTTRPRSTPPAAAEAPLFSPDAVATPAEPTGSLVVEVRTFRNEPIAGALVEAHRRSPETPTADARQASGADGVARFPRLPGGAWSVFVRADGCADASGRAVVPPESERRITLYIDRGYEIRGKVRDATGAPVPAAVVDWVQPRPRPVVASAAGEFVLSGLPSGEIQLRAGRSKDALSHAQLVRVPEVTTIDVLLIDFPTVTVTGSVIDDESGVPIAGVAVACAVAGPTPCATDADGRFRLAGVGRNFLDLIALSKPGYRRFPAPRATTPIPSSSDVVDVGVLRMQHGATIEVTVTSPEGPMAGASVTIVSPSRLTGSERRDARTDSAGRVTFASVEAGSTQLNATAPGFISGTQRSINRTLEVPDRGRVRSELTFTRGAVVEGRVIDDDGRGVPGAHVVADVQTTTGADGSFHCEGVVPRTGVPILVMADGYTRNDSKVDVTSGTTSNLVLGIRRSPVVRGRLLARDGRALENARVRVVAGTPRDPARIAGNDLSGGPFPVLADGSFEGRVPDAAAGVFTVVAWTTSHAPSCSAPVTIIAGQREYGGVEVMLDAGTTVRGRVVADGNGVGGAAVRLGFAGYGYTAPPIRAISNAAGAFAIDHIAPPAVGGLYVTASAAGYIDAVANPGPEAVSDLTLVLERPLDISGVVETSDHTPLARVWVRADPIVPVDVGPIPPQHTSVTDDAGRFRMQGLRAGKYRLTVVRPGKPTAEAQSIDAGVADVVLVVGR